MPTTSKRTTTQRRAKASPPSRRSSGPRNAPAPRRYGSESPRLWTKPLRKLTPTTSLGYEAIEFWLWIRARLLQVALELDDPSLADLVPEPLPWQRWFLIHALELLPGKEKIFRFRTVLLLVARQNGKSSLLVMLILWRLFTDGAPMIIGAAQTLDVAEETWSRVVNIAEAVPELAAEIDKVSDGNGKRFIRLDTRERYRPQAASGRGGRGWSGDMVLLDELNQQKTWAAWSAISKTTMARPRAQVYGVSNAGDSTAVVLRHLRKMALNFINGEVGDGTDDLDEELAALLRESAIGLFEWSAEESRSIRDRDGWYEANPALGHTITEAAIAAALSDPEWVFRAEVLNQFVNLANVGPFPNGSWAGCRETTVERDTKRQPAFCVELSHDRTWASIGIAYFDTQGRRRVELAARRPGTEWIIPWLQSPDRRVKPERITLQTRGAPASSLVEEFRKAGIELTDWEGPDLARACGMFYDGIRRAVADDLDEFDGELAITHGDQPALDIAANSARIKALGDGWAVDRKNSPEDAAPLMAVIGAHWLLMTESQTFRSAYEDGDLMVV